MDFTIVADDLTGAADSGVQFARNGHRTAIFFEGERPRNGDLDVIVLDTDSRAETEAEARRRVTVAGESIRGARVVFKKIDSTLRGNIAPEIDALLRAVKRRRVVVAPAFPSGHRTTVGGVQLLDGVPVHQTELARDPKTPVAESDLSRILSPVGAVGIIGARDLEDAEKARESILASEIVVCDATEDEHLAMLVRAVPDASEVVWVGSAGLARALAETYPGGGSMGSLAFAAGRVLAVVGSLSGVSREQLRIAAERDDATPVSLLRNDIEATTSQAAPALQSGDVILHSPESDGSLSSVEITAALAEVVSGLVGSFDALVLTGGDTAVGVSRRLGATGLEVFGEVEAGVPFGVLTGRVHYPVITKAGGFGEPDTLSRAMSFLRGEVG